MHVHAPDWPHSQHTHTQSANLLQPLDRPRAAPHPRSRPPGPSPRHHPSHSGLIGAPSDAPCLGRRRAHRPPSDRPSDRPACRRRRRLAARRHPLPDLARRRPCALSAPCRPWTPRWNRLSCRLRHCGRRALRPQTAPALYPSLSRLGAPARRPDALSRLSLRAGPRRPYQLGPRPPPLHIAARRRACIAPTRQSLSRRFRSLRHGV